MKQNKQDRRSQRTKRLVTSAMLELLFERHYDTITIQNILDRAGIGRSTFYTHYFDKEDVLTGIAEHMLETFGEQFSHRKVEQGIIPALELFQHVQQNYQYFQAMMRGNAAEVLWEAAQTTLSTNIERTLTATYKEKPSPSVPWDVTSQYLAGSFLHLMKWWLRAEMPYSPAQMEHIFQQLALPGVRSTIENLKK